MPFPSRMFMSSLIGWIGYLRGVGLHIGLRIYSYILLLLFIPSGSSSLELGIRWVLTCLLCDWSKCAASVLRSWYYVTGPYQDSPFYETVDSTVCLASSWLSVRNSWYLWGFLMSLAFRNWFFGRPIFWSSWYLAVPFWKNWYFMFGRIIWWSFWSYPFWSNWYLAVPFGTNRYLVLPFWSNWYLVAPSWINFYLVIPFLVKLLFGRTILETFDISCLVVSFGDLWSYHYWSSLIFRIWSYHFLVVLYHFSRALLVEFFFVWIILAI